MDFINRSMSIKVHPINITSIKKQNYKIHGYYQQNMVIINKTFFNTFNIGDNHSPAIQAILNVSPESFYKGSVVEINDLEETISNYITHGAKIIDLGGRSTAPGVAPITVEEELARVKSYLTKLLDFLDTNIIISIDTQYSKIAEFCIKYCKERGFNVIINDVSGLRTDRKMTNLILDYDVPLILMASNQKPGDILSVNSIIENLFNNIIDLERKGYDLDKLIIDPGVGKWVPEKTYEYDLAIVDNLERFRIFGNPILVGISRKSFIGNVLNKKQPAQRFYGSLAATSIAVYNGAHIIRTHDVNRELQEMITMAKHIRKKPLLIEKEGISGGLIGCIKDPLEGRYYQRLLGVTPAGSRIMDKKMVTKLILLKNVTAPQALVLKQEMLARGGDAAIHKDAVTTEYKKYDKNQNCILIGTEKQLYSLINKLNGQQLELDKIGLIVKEVLEKSREDKFLHSI
ncbi:MAG: dihydropteroate synthase [Candidatus Lokiarchaeota archaeon]|nr:dihydropteroate synthase [Candidatus Lokiarchaeota archaeon]